MDDNERRIVGITMVGHAMVHVFELSIPVFIPIWLAVFQLTPAEIGLIVAVGYGVYGLGAIPSGVLVDRFGALRLILLCLSGMAVAFFAASFATHWAVIAFAMIAWGMAASLYHPAGLSVLSTDVRQRGRALGYHGMAGNVGIALGPFATMVLLLFFDWRLVIALLAAPAALAVPLILSTGFEESVGQPVGDGGESRPGRADHLRGVAGDLRALFVGGFILVFLLYILEGLYYRGLLTFLPEMLASFAIFEPISVFGETVDPAQYLYAGLLLVGVVGQYVGGTMTDRIKPERGIVVAFAGLAILAVLFVPAVEAGVGPVLVVCGLLGVFLFGLQPFMQASVAEHSARTVRGLSFGLVFAGLFGVGALGAAVAGFVLTYATMAVLFLVLASFGACAVIVGAVLLRRP